LDDKGLSFFTEAAKEIRLSKSIDELNYALDEKNIKYILMQRSFDAVYWGEDTTLKKYVNSEYIKETVEMSSTILYERK
jgi:hypothetical protein